MELSIIGEQGPIIKKLALRSLTLVRLFSTLSALNEEAQLNHSSMQR